MITFSVSQNKVLIHIETDLTKKIQAVYNCGENGELYAQLLCNHLHERLFRTNQDFAKDNYNKGWSDKASHKMPKQEWFPGNINYRNKK